MQATDLTIKEWNVHSKQYQLLGTNALVDFDGLCRPCLLFDWKKKNTLSEHLGCQLSKNHIQYPPVDNQTDF